MAEYDDEKLERIFEKAAEERSELMGVVKVISTSIPGIEKSLNSLETLVRDLDRRITVLETVQATDGKDAELARLHESERDLYNKLNAVTNEQARVKERVIFYGAIAAFVGVAVIEVGLRLVANGG